MSLFHKLDIFNVIPVVEKMYVHILLGTLLRLGLMTSKYKNIFANRIEISTPLNSWKNVLEGVHRINLNINPYLGDQFHEPPHNLHVYHQIISYTNTTTLPLIFILCDVLTSILLYKTAQTFLRYEYKQQNNQFETEVAKLRISGSEAVAQEIEKNRSESVMFLKEACWEQYPIYCAIMYLFNPFSVVNCVAQTTTVFGNLINAGLLYSVVHNHFLLSIICLSLGTTQSLYPITLVAPVIIKFCNKDTLKESILKAILVIAMLAVNIAVLALLSRYLAGSWSFLENVYSFILTVKNLRPNTGLFWYMFTEMFEHYNALFTAAFQINALVLYIAPMSFRLRRDPTFLCVVFFMLNTIFKSYPCFGDVGFYIAVLPIWFNLLCYLQQAFLIVAVLLVTVVLGPVVWYLWIITGAANANFYFGVTLCYSTAQIFLLSDLVFCYVKREFWLRNNCRHMSPDNELKLGLE